MTGTHLKNSSVAFSSDLPVHHGTTCRQAGRRGGIGQSLGSDLRFAEGSRLAVAMAKRVGKARK